MPIAKAMPPARKREGNPAHGEAGDFGNEDIDRIGQSVPAAEPTEAWSEGIGLPAKQGTAKKTARAGAASRAAGAMRAARTRAMRARER